MRELQDPGRDTDRVIGEPEWPQQPSQSSGHETHVPEQLDVSMPDPESPETPGDPAETSDDDREWRPEYEVPPPEPHDPVVTRRRVVCKETTDNCRGGRTPTETNEIGIRVRIVSIDQRGIV